MLALRERRCPPQFGHKPGQRRPGTGTTPGTARSRPRQPDTRYF